MAAIGRAQADAAEWRRLAEGRYPISAPAGSSRRARLRRAL